MQDVQITPSFRFNPYLYQQPVFTKMNDGIKRIILVWPRRAGKDLTLLNLVTIQSQLRIGTYFYFFPTHKQAKRVIWDGMDDEGVKFLDYIPQELIEDKNESELQIKLTNGSIIQLLGADTIDTSALGTNCVGCVFSEYPVQQPAGWTYVRPILAKNGGWAAFAYTPRGHNHGWELYDKNKDNPEWYVSKLTALDILGHHGERLIDDNVISSERRSGMDEDTIQQEFFTSFSGLQQGSYFSDQAIQASEVDIPPRFGVYPYVPDVPVHTVSDLGVGLNFVTWFFQLYHGMIRWIDFNALDSGAIPEFAKMIKTKEYVYGRHFAPFDIKTKDIGSGYTRIFAAKKLGIHFTQLPKLAVSDRIDIGRRHFPISVFHKPRVDDGNQSGWKALLNYRRKFDELLREYGTEEVHDWASHGGSAFTYGCVAVARFMNVASSHGGQAVTDFDEMDNESPRDSYERDFDEMGSVAEGDFY